MQIFQSSVQTGRFQISPRLRLGLGFLGIGFYGIHAGYNLVRGTPENLLWMCHIASAAIGLSLILRWPLLNAWGVLVLTLGVPLWIIHLALGGDFQPPSPFTHVGGLLLGVVGLCEFGFPSNAWWKTLAAHAMVRELCHWVTPPEQNVNLAFYILPSWKPFLPPYPIYSLGLLILTGALFWLFESAYRRMAPASTDGHGPSNPNDPKFFSRELEG